MPLPDLALPGVLTSRQLAATARSIADAQQPDGAIPWFPGGHVDAWDHVECAMALTVAGDRPAAAAAYRQLAATQRPDGSWPARVQAGVVEDAGSETNHVAYVAVGVWHWWRATGDADLPVELWPVVRAALDRVVGLQLPSGGIAWRIDDDGRPSADALLTGSASTFSSLRCGLALAERLGDPQPGWARAADRLAAAVCGPAEAFLDKSRYSMDWYYPALGGACRSTAALDAIDARWEEFVVPGLGARCVADQPWVTGAETCELALALDCLGERERAVGLVADMQHLREPDGSYWTGWQFADRVFWPVEHSTWTAAAVVLAVDALVGVTPAAGLFRDLGRAVVPTR